MGVARARSEASTRGLTLDDTNGGSTKVADVCDSGRDGGDGSDGSDGDDRDYAGNNAGSADSGGADSGWDSGGASAGRGCSCDR